MSRLRRLNRRGKIAVVILLTGAIFLFSGLLGGKKDFAMEGDATALETLSVSFEPMVSFADSNLSQSIIEKEKQEKEEARQIAIAKQKEEDQEENAIYLTFDDGPSEIADELLDILNDYNMIATFFMLGPNMEEHPEVVKRMEEEGFGLALHGITHEVQEVYGDASAPVEEMTDGQEILEDITDFSSDMVRLPYGSVPYLTEEMRFLLDQDDFNIWDWNVDSRDWELTDESYVQHTVEEIERIEETDEAPVVLLHDKEETIKHLPELLSYIQKQGYKTKLLDNDMVPITFPCEGRCQPID